MKKALLVIDMQNVSVGEDHASYFKYDCERLTGVNGVIDENQIECVEVVGVDGGACVSATAVGAVRAGYEVTVRKDAVGTMFVSRMKKRLRKWGICES